MLAQHVITRPVFDTLFKGNRFTADNAVSKAMENVLSQIYAHNIESESETLNKFYTSVRRRAADIISATGRQTLILELYDRFFRNAFPLMTQKLGIVYTPTEVVEFIIYSVEDMMQQDFSSSLGNNHVHILDPFSGTGTFISQLLQSGILSKDQIKRKFKSEIHANEIVLLAYYIACINIEAVYDDIMKENQYQTFDGMVLTDTFQLYEQEKDMIANLLPDNSERRTKQKKREITVIIGNPPYSIGQNSENDDAKNTRYINLESRIEETYSKQSRATLKRGLYDSYVKAIRWASDRLGASGIIGFVCNSGWLDKNFADGMRLCLQTEFSSIKIVNLRGDIRKNMLSKGIAREGENIFGQGSMTGCCIVLFTKKDKSKMNANKICEIQYINIGDNLTKKQKLDLLKSSKNFNGLCKILNVEKIIPEDNGDWLNKGDKAFYSYLELGNKRDNTNAIFSVYSLGIATNRDA